MNSEERLNRIEKILEANSRQLGSVVQESDKQNDAISKLIVVARTCLDSIKDMRESHEAIIETSSKHKLQPTKS